MSYLTLKDEKNRPVSVAEAIKELQSAAPLENIKQELREIFTGYLTSKIYAGMDPTQQANIIFTHHIVEDFLDHLQFLKREEMRTQ